MQYLSGEQFGPPVGWAMWHLGRGMTRAQAVEALRQTDEYSWLTREQARAVVRQAEYNRSARLRVESEGTGRPIEQYFSQPLAGCDSVGIRVVWDVETNVGTVETVGYIYNVPQGMTLADALERASVDAALRAGASPKLGGPATIISEPRVVSMVECGFPNAMNL